MSTSPRVWHPTRREPARARFSRVQASHWGKALVGLLAMGAATVLTVALAIWVIPWVPIGMTQDDYSPAVLVAVVLAMISTLMSFIAALARGSASGSLELAELLQSLLGMHMRLRNRQQFHNRLARECRRAQRERRSWLSLILVQVPEGKDRDGSSSAHALEHVGHTLTATVRAGDIVRVAGDNEIGVLAIGADVKARDVISARLRRALAAVSGDSTKEGGSSATRQALLGASTFGPDGTEPEILLMAARSSFAPVVPRSKKAA